MQNIPKTLKKKGADGVDALRVGLRDMFVARPGQFLVECDYSQLELRILALLSGDAPLLATFAAGKDVHDANTESLFNVLKVSTAADTFKQLRDMAKRFVYGLNYGAGDKTIHKSLVVHFPQVTLEGIAEMRARWEGAHPQLAVWQKEQVRLGRERHYVEAPLSGRRYHFYLGRLEPSICFNYPMQSTGADIINGATLTLDGDLDRRRGEHIVLQVHDALVCEGPDPAKLAELMKRRMQVPVTLNGVTATFPVDVSAGTSWGDMKPWGH
jgi:DNA polymerase-1